MKALTRTAVLAAFPILMLAASVTVAHSATIDPRLIGGWTASAADCQKFFERTNGELTYRQPVDRFAQAFIIEPGQLEGPSTGTCRVVSVHRAQSPRRRNAETLLVICL